MSTTFKPWETLYKYAHVQTHRTTRIQNHFNIKHNYLFPTYSIYKVTQMHSKDYNRIWVLGSWQLQAWQIES
jgi:hypothetical protein